MKRIGISLLIGAACSLLFFAIKKLSENKVERMLSDLPAFQGRIKLKIGSPDNSDQLIEATLNQIRIRIDYDDNTVSRKVDKNTFEISAKKIDDTVILKKFLTESVRIEFTELFTIDEINNSFTEVEKIQTKKRDNFKKDFNSVTAILSDEASKSAKVNGYAQLGELVQFSQPFQLPSGENRFPGQIGFIKKRDTAFLNKILNDPEIMGKFPELLRFSYGAFNSGPLNPDSILSLFALKPNNESIYKYLTSDQITNAVLSFEPATNSPIIQFALDATGTDAWYFMTRKNIGRPIAIVANDFVLCGPVVESAIESGESQIAGSFTVSECFYLSKMLKSKELKLPVKIIESNFKTASQNNIKPLLILFIIFLFTAALSYGISFLIKPAPKP